MPIRFVPIRFVDKAGRTHYGLWLRPIIRLVHHLVSMLDQFQVLDDLIFRLTELPVRAELRNQLALAREQVEAYQASSDKQDETLARQAEAIGALEQKNAKLEAKAIEIQAENEALKSKFTSAAARAKKIPEMEDKNRFLATELAKARAEVKRLEAEIKLRDEGTEPGFSVSS